jgi:hypothetical protein
VAISLQKFETSFWRSKTLVIFKTNTVLESPNLVDYKIDNAKSEIQKNILIRGPPQGGYPNQVPLGDIEYFISESVYQKKFYGICSSDHQRKICPGLQIFWTPAWG